MLSRALALAGNVLAKESKLDKSPRFRNWNLFKYAVILNFF